MPSPWRRQDVHTTTAVPVAWRAEFSNLSLNVLHAEAFHHAALDYDWLAQVRGHSLGWVCAFDGDSLIGFVNLAWDGDDHAFILATTVLQRYERQGVGTRLVALATERARAAGCQWLHSTSTTRAWAACTSTPAGSANHRRPDRPHRGRANHNLSLVSPDAREGCTDAINSMPKFAASTTLNEPLEWNATLLDMVEAVETLNNFSGLRNVRQGWLGGCSWPSAL